MKESSGQKGNLGGRNPSTRQHRLTVISSYQFVDTNATKARLLAYLTVLHEEFDIIFIAPKSDGVVPYGGIEVNYVGDSPAHGGMLSRAFREILYALKIVPHVYRSRPDLVLITMPSIFLQLLAVVVNKPIVFDVRDLVWEYLPSGTNVERYLKNGLKKISQYMISKAKLVLVTNDSEKKYMLDFLVKDIPVLLVRNGISRERYRDILSIPGRHDNGEFEVLYIGNIGKAQNLTTLIDAINSVQNVKATIVGKGNELDSIKLYARKYNKNKVDFIGGVTWEELLRYYDQADVLYAQIGSDFDSAIPSKLYEYMAVGIPVIFGGSGESISFLEQFSGVLAIPPNDVMELVVAIEVMKKTDLRKENINRNRDLIWSKYIREVQVHNVVCHLKVICNG